MIKGTSGIEAVCSVMARFGMLKSAINVCATTTETTGNCCRDRCRRRRSLRQRNGWSRCVCSHNKWSTCGHTGNGTNIGRWGIMRICTFGFGAIQSISTRRMNKMTLIAVETVRKGSALFCRMMEEARVFLAAIRPKTTSLQRFCVLGVHLVRLLMLIAK
jgi:hypothetical protein